MGQHASIFPVSPFTEGLSNDQPRGRRVAEKEASWLDELTASLEALGVKRR